MKTKKLTQGILWVQGTLWVKMFTATLLSLMLVTTLATPAVVFAGSADDLLWGGKQGDIEASLGLGNEDPREIVASVISVLLGFLGILAVLIILFAGFKWMTAGGNDDNVASAKKMLTAGIIGLVIVLASFGLAQMVIQELYTATGAN